ncbi:MULTISPECIES: ATP-binding protein [unclassified Kaistella]|uniref:ATP-binding protein n=1 Tax=unclassified Kaistella TaxID=2762626 RepID=UPI002736493A|nr:MULTISPECIES: ATP-binding protein [unclassified Kaistella]MDP2454651.1 ATP-binding protein [Kaistella sp. SH11-4b]MDP2457388.1 ATP-binding protein [Kaistella sp. SH40-3]MDP2460148.1 ATP-binding protein [Kaistella sp. SH19-2b]
MNSYLLFALVVLYLGLLFFIAYFAEKRRSSFWVNNPYVYALSLAVYCSAWTYYGSIGVAANQGLEYMAIYIGPIIIIPAWIYINSKIIRISRVNKISSIADFISLRYGNSRSLSALIALVCMFAIIPYVGLQIKAISETFHLITETDQTTNIFFDSATYVVLIIALFSSYYGTKYVDASEKRLGIISAVAVESFLKLIFFITLGIFVVYGVFNGFEDIYNQAEKLPDFAAKNTFNGLEGGFNWFLMSMLSMSAIFLLPRQFHTAIIENRKEKHIKTAIWLFPLYLLIFNFFVFPIAWGGKILFFGEDVNPELYSILIPQKFGNTIISTMVFFGGLSACISMIIISSISLSIMLSNNIIIPYGWLDRFKFGSETDNTKNIVNIRKISIFLLILVSFIFYKYFILGKSLFSIGLVSFVLIAQLAPSFFGAIFWRRGTYLGSMTGIIVGVIICYLGLVLPSFSENYQQSTFFNHGFFSFFNIPYLSSIPQIFFWSLLVNCVLFTLISTNTVSDYRERNYAEIYVDINDYIQNHEGAYIWKGTANVSDIQKILVRFLGEKKTEQALKIFNLKYKITDDSDTADSRFIKFSENLLSGRIGTASAKILIEGVTKEDKISLPEVLKILEESKENISINKQLSDQSSQLLKLSDDLQNANKNLIVKDKQKDEFLDSVAHELRTPLTAIRATSEILLDDEEMPAELKKDFLENIISESDRLSEIINDILYLDKLETGTIPLNIQSFNIIETFRKSVKPLLHLFEQRSLHHSEVNLLENEIFEYDESRMIQVFQNILGNALKFTNEQGMIQTKFQKQENQLKISIFNTGKIIPTEDLAFIFEKFYQSKNQNLQKPTGSGLGLAICNKIMIAHGGDIEVKNKEIGVTFEIFLPIKEHNNELEEFNNNSRM